MQIDKTIRNRRAIFPAQYIDQEISKEDLLQILENANWAPTHKKTQPWRFKIIQGEARARLGSFLAEWCKENTSPEKFKEMKYGRTLKKPSKADTIIAICVQPDPTLPEWEEIAATACAVQNMWLSCSERKIGCYWSSPKSIHAFDQFHPLAEGEKCIGFFYMGYYQGEAPTGERTPINKKLEWISR